MIYEVILWSSLTVFLAAGAAAVLLLARYCLLKDLLRRMRSFFDGIIRRISVKDIQAGRYLLPAVIVLVLLAGFSVSASVSGAGSDGSEGSAGSDAREEEQPEIGVTIEMEDVYTDPDGTRYYRSDNAGIRVTIQAEEPEGSVDPADPQDPENPADPEEPVDPQDPDGADGPDVSGDPPAGGGDLPGVSGDPPAEPERPKGRIQSYHISVQGTEGTLEEEVSDLQEDIYCVEWTASAEETAALGDGEVRVYVLAETASGTAGEAEDRFVLDLTPPVLREVAVNTLSEDGALKENVSKELFHGGDLYYNEREVTTVFVLEEEHKGAWTVRCDRQGTGIVRTGEGGDPSITLREEGIYQDFYMETSDLAGNKLQRASAVHCAQDGETVEVHGERASLHCRKILDRTCPQAVIRYSSGAPFYLYEGEKTAYCSGDIDVRMQVADLAGDTEMEESTVSCALYALREDGQGKDGQTRDGQTRGGQTGEKVPPVYTVETDGALRFAAEGADAAGNPVSVREILDGEIIPGAGAGSLSGRGTEDISREDGYLLVRDTCCPVLGGSLKKPALCEEACDEEKDITYYSAAPSAYEDGVPAMGAEFRIVEKNADPSLVNVHWRFAEAGEGGFDAVLPEDLSDVETYASPGDAAGDITGDDAGGAPEDAAEDASEEVTEDGIRISSFRRPGTGGTKDGVYCLVIEGTDRAGNPLRLAETEAERQGDPGTDRQAGTKQFRMYCEDHEAGRYRTGRLVADTTPPEGILSVYGEDPEPYYVVRITPEGILTEEEGHSLYRKESRARLEIRSSDSSPTDIFGRIVSTAGPQPVLQGEPEGSAFGKTVSAEPEGEQIFRAEQVFVRDRAGNESAVLPRTADISLQAELPGIDLAAPQISFYALTPVSGESDSGVPLFRESLKILVRATDPGTDGYSAGLGTISYDLLEGGEYLVRDKEIFAGGKEPVFDYSETIIIPADDNTETGDLELILHAKDRAGNESGGGQGGSFRFRIDTAAPGVSVRYSNNAVQNGKYFAQPRSAEIVVTDRNIDPGRIRILAEGGTVYGWTGAEREREGVSGDSRICRVEFGKDADCSLAVEGTDAAGNPAEVSYEGAAPQEFTVDTTPPSIDVKFEDGRNGGTMIFNSSRVAVINVREQNFSPSELRITPAAEILPETTPDADGGMIHTAVVRCEEDGTYRITVSCADLAGNRAVPYISAPFTVDTKAPSIVVEGAAPVTNAEAGDFMPKVRFSDERLDPESVRLEMERLSGIGMSGASSGTAGSHSAVIWREESETDRESDLLGKSYVPEQFTDDRGNDGIWILTASASDLAGNRSELTRKYCINRTGSVFSVPDPTAGSVRDGYLEPGKEFLISEANVSPVVSRKVTVFRNTESMDLRENEGFTLEEVTEEGDYQALYRLEKSCFERQGHYRILVQTVDEAGNISSTSGAEEPVSGKVRELPLSFTVDTEAPVCRIAGIDTGRHSFVTNELPLRVLCSDNEEIRDLEIRVRDEDGAVISEISCTGEDLLKVQEPSGSGIPVILAASAKEQVLEAEATDGAGNRGTLSYRVFITGSYQEAVKHGARKAAGTGFFIAALAGAVLLLVKILRHRRPGR